MDNEKIGNLICKLRKEKQMTQLELANAMNISDKTVSKWERGLGCPDISLLSELCRIFNVDIEQLLNGEIIEKGKSSGNMKNLCIFVCPNCGNIIVGFNDANISCCGKKLNPLVAQEVKEKLLCVEQVETDYYITSNHPMTREHYISFVALLNADTYIFKKLYPEWNLETRIPIIGHGRLLWYCTEHGLCYQNI